MLMFLSEDVISLDKSPSASDERRTQYNLNLQPFVIIADRFSDKLDEVILRGRLRRRVILETTDAGNSEEEIPVRLFFLCIDLIYYEPCIRIGGVRFRAIEEAVELEGFVVVDMDDLSWMNYTSTDW